MGQPDFPVAFWWPPPTAFAGVVMPRNCWNFTPTSRSEKDQKKTSPFRGVCFIFASAFDGRCLSRSLHVISARRMFKKNNILEYLKIDKNSAKLRRTPKKHNSKTSKQEPPYSQQKPAQKSYHKVCQRHRLLNYLHSASICICAGTARTFHSQSLEEGNCNCVYTCTYFL